MWAASTFASMANGQAMKLGDLKFVQDGCNYAWCGAASIAFLNYKGANLKLTAKETTGFVGMSATFYYLSQEEIDEAKAAAEEPGADPDTIAYYNDTFTGVTAGWYHESEAMNYIFTENFNDYAVPFGAGYGINGLDSEGGVNILYAGSVVPNAEMPAIEATYDKTVWTGNCAPKNMKLGDFSFVQDGCDYAWCGAGSIAFLNYKGANLKLTEKETTGFVGKSATFYYLSQEEIDEAKAAAEDPGADPDTIAYYNDTFTGVTAGWYQESEAMNYTFTENFNEYEVPAGQGFGINGLDSEGGVHLVLPGAL